MRKLLIKNILAALILIVPAGMPFGAGTSTDTGIQEKADRKEGDKIMLHNGIAGRWYPADKKALDNLVSGLFASAAEIKPAGDVVALILPHAGYQYSGKTAAKGLKLSGGKKYKRVVIIGPSHQLAMRDKYSVPLEKYYQTPLGTVELDVDFARRLLEEPVFKNIPDACEYEHSVGIQVPLLQNMSAEPKYVLIVAGQCSPQTIQKAAAIIRKNIDDQTLVVASSDFVHYGPNYGYVPFKTDIEKNLEKLDMGAYEYISRLDGEGFLRYEEKTAATICGTVPIATLLAMMDKDVKVGLVEYTTSGALTGDFGNSVSYMAIAFSQSPKITSALRDDRQDTTKPADTLSEKDKQELLKLARKTIRHYLETKRKPSPSQLGIEITEAMKQKRAVFVTLHKAGQLRGCIGDIIPQTAFYDSVIRNAINAAVKDWRFEPLTLKECDQIDIEISALTVPRAVKSAKDIQIGTDGIILEKAGARAVFLPQVAPEQGWGLEETLDNLALKAGLKPGAWKSGTSFEVFEAEVFGETK